MLAVASGCPGPKDFIECEDDTNCSRETGGRCLVNPDTDHQFCAYPDPGCSSGMRWSDLDVEDSISGECVAGDPDAGTDTTPPTIVARSPDANATGVSRTAAVSVMFSEPIAPSSVTASSFQVMGPGGALAGQLAVDGPSATFTPTSPLTPSTQYTVNIGTQVTDLASNPLASSSTWMFTTGSASWSTPSLLETEMNMSASKPRVAWGGSIVMAVWLMAPCSGAVCQLPTQLWYSVRQGGVWSPGAAIAGVTGTLHEPSLTVDAMGRAAVVYPATVSNRISIYATIYSGGTWSAPSTIETDDTGNATQVASAVDAGGNVYAVWQQNDGQRDNIIGNRYVPGVGWGTAAPLEQSATAAATPSVAAGADGAAFAAWTQGTMMYGARFSTGAWGQPSVAGSGSGRIRVAMHTDGSAIVVWPNGNDVLANRNTGAWGTAAPIDGLDGTAFQAFALAMPEGRAMALWTQSGDLWQCRYDPAQGWGAAFRIETAGGTAQYPTLAFAPDGSGLGAWEQPSPATTVSPWANLFLPTSGWGAAQLAKPDDGVSVREPTSFYDPQGNAFGAVWLASPSGYPSVYAASLQ
ncbi:MAG: Ig-like domain-containing protein [Myxococcales bacterium]|nr:Ig-like domain-containing protein [Myxococcales bacterium]